MIRILMLAVLFSSINSFETIDDPCYDRQTGIAQRCIPQFENVAYNKQVWSSSQCGSQSPMNYCIEPFNLNTKQTTTRSVKHCDRCDSTIPESIRDTRYLTDLEESNSTCWVSAPVYEPTQQSNITLQISFGKKYELTYISLQFCTALKPDSLTVLKSMDYGKTWIPFQYYSSDCKKVFNRQLKVKISQANEQEAVCTDQHLQSSPFSTNRIGFSTLEGRPSFHEFDTSPVLQDWVTATDIRVVFNRLLSPSLLLQNNNNNNSADRHIRSNSRHLRSQQLQMQIQNLGYYYAAVSELAIGGRCKCNGHASRCLLNKQGKYECDCKHNTAGAECERCLPFHYDRPWARATPRDANECIACNCNNHSEQCKFNLDLFKLSGARKSGGVCINCRHNTMGRNCHYCKSGYFRNWQVPITSKLACKACNCNSHSNKCRFNKDLYLLSGRKSGGVCVNCKHNTAGRYCHYCREGFYRDQEFPITHKRACQECNCHMIGSAGKTCNQSSGQCPCKEGVTGLRCDRCKKGYQQTNSAIVPCIKIVETTTTTTTTTSTTTTTTTPITTAQVFQYYRDDQSSKQQNDYYYDDSEDSCEYCKLKTQRVTFKEFCQANYVTVINLINRKSQPETNKQEFACNIDTIYKSSSIQADEKQSSINRYYEIVNINKKEIKNNFFQEDDKTVMWVDNKDLLCNCPKLNINKKYLLMAKSNTLVRQQQQQQQQQIYDQVNSYEESFNQTKIMSNNSQQQANFAGILLDRETFITEWKPELVKRLRRFMKHYQNGKC